MPHLLLNVNLVDVISFNFLNCDFSDILTLVLFRPFRRSHNQKYSSPFGFPLVLLNNSDSIHIFSASPHNLYSRILELIVS